MGSAAIPMTEAELLAVNGVGQRKLERFGEVIIDYCRR
ncbi:HRDC domain-containing protein [Aeromonas bivalvium]